MKFDTPAANNPIDRLRIVGKPVDRIDGPFKTTGTAPYAYERHDVAANQAYGYVLGSAIAKGRINAMDTAAARRAPGVLAIVTAENAGTLGQGEFYVAKALAGVGYAGVIGLEAAASGGSGVAAGDEALSAFRDAFTGELAQQQN